MQKHAQCPAGQGHRLPEVGDHLGSRELLGGGDLADDDRLAVRPAGAAPALPSGQDPGEAAEARHVLMGRDVNHMRSSKSPDKPVRQVRKPSEGFGLKHSYCAQETY